MVSNESTWFRGLPSAKLAYQLWEERGRPLGSPEQDWLRAERSLRHHLGPSSPNGQEVFPLSAISLEPEY